MEAATGFEPVDNGFAIRRVGPLRHTAEAADHSRSAQGHGLREVWPGPHAGGVIQALWAAGVAALWSGTALPLGSHLGASGRGRGALVCLAVIAAAPVMILGGQPAAVVPGVGLLVLGWGIGRRWGRSSTAWTWVASAVVCGAPYAAGWWFPWFGARGASWAVRLSPIGAALDGMDGSWLHRDPLYSGVPELSGIGPLATSSVWLVFSAAAAVGIALGLFRQAPGD